MTRWLRPRLPKTYAACGRKCASISTSNNYAEIVGDSDRHQHIGGHFRGGRGRDVDALDVALANNPARLPPVVVTEILSARNAPERVTQLILALPILDVGNHFWERAGRLRRRVLARGLKAALADALICQSCLDYDLPPLTRDQDFRHYATHGGLKLG